MDYNQIRNFDCWKDAKKRGSRGGATWRRFSENPAYAKPHLCAL